MTFQYSVQTDGHTSDRDDSTIVTAPTRRIRRARARAVLG